MYCFVKYHIANQECQKHHNLIGSYFHTTSTKTNIHFLKIPTLLKKGLFRTKFQTVLGRNLRTIPTEFGQIGRCPKRPRRK